MEPGHPDPERRAGEAEQLTFKELVDLTGESERTLRYYLQLGLLSGPSSAGPAARYAGDNVRRVEYIRGRQRDGLGLRDIQRELRGAEPRPSPIGSEAPGRPAGAAIDTLAHLRGGEASADSALGRRDGTRRAATWAPARESWERQVLDDGIELWVRRPLDPHRQKLLGQLLAQAEALFAGATRSRS